MDALTRMLRCICKILSIQEPPGLFNSTLLLTRHSTDEKDSYIKPLILIDHRSELPCSQSPDICLTNGTQVKVKVNFDIEVFRFDIDGLPRVDILLTFDELVALPRKESTAEINVSTVSPNTPKSSPTIKTQIPVIGVSEFFTEDEGFLSIPSGGQPRICVTPSCT